MRYSLRNSKQRGSSHVLLTIAIVVAIVGALGFVGFNAWKKSQDQGKVADAAAYTYSKKSLCDSLGRKFSGDPSWGKCYKACKDGSTPVVMNPWDTCRGYGTLAKKPSATPNKSVKKCPSHYEAIATTEKGYNCRSLWGKTPKCEKSSYYWSGSQGSRQKYKGSYKYSCIHEDSGGVSVSSRGPICGGYGAGYSYSPTMKDCRHYTKKA